jgi:hyperosmotically inducible periplasmic protein
MYQHRLRRAVHAFVFTGVAMLFVIAVHAQTAPAPDNTKVNTRDRAKGAVTADQQKENAGDRDLTRKIRQSLIKDTTLSSYAHNVKVIAQGGQVTLKGPVRSDDEKRAVEAKATEVAGPGHVTNQMSVAPARSKKTKA